MTLSNEQLEMVGIAGRVSSILSILGSFVIIGAFCLSRYFRSPIHRIIFFNAFYNLIDSAGTMISISGPAAGDTSSLCQFQGFALQMYIPPLSRVRWHRAWGLRRANFRTTGFHLRMFYGHLQWVLTHTSSSFITLMPIPYKNLRLNTSQRYPRYLAYLLLSFFSSEHLPEALSMAARLYAWHIHSIRSLTNVADSFQRFGVLYLQSGCSFALCFTTYPCGMYNWRAPHFSQ